MRPIAADRVAWSVCICVLVTTVSPAKAAEPIDRDAVGWGRLALTPRGKYDGMIFAAVAVMAVVTITIATYYYFTIKIY